MKLPPALVLLLIELLLHLGDVQAVIDELIGVEAHLIFAGGAAETGHVDNVGHGLESLFHHPVFERLDFHHVVAGIGTFQ